MRFETILAPVLEQPVVIIESDDWGPGPQAQVQALSAIRSLLKNYHDGYGHHPVMTIGVVLSLPDPDKIISTGQYHARFLDSPIYRSILETLLTGDAEGVFDLQLHGLAHFWPANFMAAWRQDEDVRNWLEKDGWRTEQLPPWLQSRWIDAASGLPSRHLDRQVIRQAVQEEVESYHRCFGQYPRVAVPPTFVWDANVEAAYAEAGIEVLITPGRRYSGRDGRGRLTSPDRGYYNGEKLACGLKTLVRDVYFEPALGHRPEEVLETIERKWMRREPALLETHRFNFLDGNLETSLAALGELLEGVLTRFPQVRFLSSHQLASAMTEFTDSSPLGRLRMLWRRGVG